MRNTGVLIATLLCAAAPGPLAGQVVAVRVVDDAGEPVAGALVEVHGADSVAVASATSDSTGFLRAGLPGEGPFFLVARRDGFLPWQSALIAVAAGESLELEIRLGRNAIPLEPLVVVARARRSNRLAGYHERLRRGGFGSFVTREEIDRRPTADVTDLLRPLAGVQIVDVARDGNPNALARLIAMRGTRGGEIPGASDTNYCLPGLFLDGVRISQSADFPVDDLILAGTLEGIEVYSTAGSVPIEYQQGGSVACGAVLFWTREGQSGEGRSGWWRWAVGIGAFAGIFLLMR